jgi:hypothetical protein
MYILVDQETIQNEKKNASISSPVPCRFLLYPVQVLLFLGLDGCPFVLMLASLRFIIVISRPTWISIATGGGPGGQVYLVSA